VSTETIEIGLRTAREFGVPFIVMAVLLWFIREAAQAMHRTVVVPLVDALSSFLRQTTATLDGLGRTQERQAETLAELAAGQRELQAAIGRVGAEGGRR
jgi:hypothetical protein